MRFQNPQEKTWRSFRLTKVNNNRFGKSNTRFMRYLCFHIYIVLIFALMLPFWSKQSNSSLSHLKLQLHYLTM